MLVEIAVLTDLPLAQLCRSRLAAEGIDAQLFDSHFAGLLGGASGVRLMVPEEDAAWASELLGLPGNKAGLP
jgi:hypothetical protein